MQDNRISIKISLLGNSGVGKSSIILRYNNDRFDPNCNSTIGASYAQKVICINDVLYQLDIWDTAGQEKYRSIGQNFYREAYIVILVYDITRQESLEGLKEMWYPDLLKFGEKYKIVAVVGNKCDRFEEENIVNEDEAREFAKEINAHFFITSAKTGTNVKHLFDKLIELYIEPDFQDKIRQNTLLRRGSQRIRNPQNEEEEKKNEEEEKKCC